MIDTHTPYATIRLDDAELFDAIRAALGPRYTPERATRVARVLCWPRALWWARLLWRV